MPPTPLCLDLPNGLRVILQESHTAPVVTTWLWLRVGSRDESEGATGLSHWVEHMLFKGSPNYPQGAIMRQINRHGGYINAMTSNDFTAYYATLPAHRADLPLLIEADRLQNATFDPEQVESERQVIIAEREGSENEPTFRLAEQVGAAAFAVHPYRHQTIGWKHDLQTLSRDQLYAHYQHHYQPNNAVLVIVGDIDPQAHLKRLHETLGALPAGPQSDHTVRPEPLQLGERRLTLHMPGSAPSIRLCYHTPPVSHPDYIPLVILDALLSGGKAMFAFGQSQARSARLYRALVETQLASAVGSGYHPSLDPYLLTLGATVRDEVQPAQVEEALLAEIARLRETPVAEDELAVAIRQTQAQFAYNSQSVTSQALTLGFLEIVDVAPQGGHRRIHTLIDELRAVTPADVQRVAQTYLHPDNRIVGWYIPGDQPSAPTLAPSAVGAKEDAPSSHPTPSPVAASAPAPTLRRHTLANGITLLIQPNPASATLTLEGYADAGAYHDTADTLGRASLMAAMLRRGSEQHTFQQLNVRLDDVGASIGFHAGRDQFGFWGRSLAADAGLLFGTLAECLTTPSFAPSELDKYRGQLLTHLGILETDTGYRADRAFMSALYGADHPYGRPTIGTRQTLTALDRDALGRYYRQQLDPRSIVISVVGDLKPQAIIDQLEATLGTWQSAGDAAQRRSLSGHNPVEIQRHCVEIPNKPQVDLILGVVGLSRRSPDYFPAMMANVILGRLGMMGRLGAHVRDEQGLAYYVSSSLRAGFGDYPWNIVAGVAPENVERAIEGILGEVRRLCDEPVSSEELADCKSYLIGALPLRLETNEGIAGFLLNIEEHDLGADYLERYPSLVGGVSAEDIQRVVRTYWADQSYVLALAGSLEAQIDA